VQQERQYVGIDLHRRRSVIVRMTGEGEKLDLVRIENDPVALAIEMSDLATSPCWLVPPGVEAAGVASALGRALRLSREKIRLIAPVGAAAGLAALFAVGGPPARALADAAVDAGMPRADVVYFETSDAAAAPIAAALRAGDVVLVKGSRGTRTDVIADRIAEEFA